MPQNPLLLDRAGLRRSGIKLSNATLLRLEARGEFPRRLRIGNSVFWQAHELDEYVGNLAARREASR